MWCESWFSPVVSVVSICLLWMILFLCGCLPICCVVPTYLIWIIGFRLMRSQSKSKLTLCVRDTWRIVGLLPSFVLLQLRCLRRCIMKIASWIIARSEVHSHCRQMVPDVSGFEFDEQAWIHLHLACALFYDGVPQIHCWNVFHALPCIKRKNINFSAAMGYSCSFLTSPWNRHKRMRSQHRTPPEVDFESVKFPAKSAFWNNLSLQSIACFPMWLMRRACRRSHAQFLFVTDLTK